MGIFRDFSKDVGSKLVKEVPVAGNDKRARDTAALEAVNSCVMVADENNVIVSVNPAATRMMQRVENDLRKDLPNFSANSIVGNSVDQFHKNPAHQQRMLAALSSTFETSIVVGGIHFDLTANPIFDEHRNRLGTVVEWEDITEKLATEQREKEVAERERIQAAANARITSALDRVASKVMVADSDNVIVYANEAVLTTLRDADSDLRTQMPELRADRIVGANIEVLGREFAVGRNSSAGQDTTVEARIKIAEQHYALRASAVKNDSGERVGTVVEWIDLMDKITIEESVNPVIARVLEGDLTGRIETPKGCSDILQAASLNINKVLDIFDAVLKDADKAISALAEGRLTQKMDGDYQGDFEILKEGVNKTIDKLVSVVNDITDSSTRVKDAAGEISRGNSNLSQRTEQQAASLEETSSAMEEITATVQQNAENSMQANTLARGAREAAENGGSVVGRAVDAMQAISESSNKITDIIGVIDEIAFQTNLLALNAAVEAARAGDQGRGFAVVADEVRSLAGRSATAAKEIKDLIKDSSEKVNEGSELVNRSGETLEEIVTAVKKVNDIVAEIATASDEQSTGLMEISRAVTEMDQMTQQNAALVEEAAAASESMNSEADSLDQLIGFFVTGVERKARALAPAVTMPRKEATVTATQRAATPARGASQASRPSSLATKAKPATEKKPEPVQSSADSEGDEWEVF